MISNYRKIIIQVIQILSALQAISLILWLFFLILFSGEFNCEYHALWLQIQYIGYIILNIIIFLTIFRAKKDLILRILTYYTIFFLILHFVSHSFLIKSRVYELYHNLQ